VDISYDIKYFREILGGRNHGPSPTSNFWAIVTRFIYVSKVSVVSELNSVELA